MVDIGVLGGGNSSSAHTISANGKVVGSSGSANGSRAFLWSQGNAIQDLGVMMWIARSLDLFAIRVLVGVNRAIHEITDTFS